MTAKELVIWRSKTGKGSMIWNRKKARHQNLDQGHHNLQIKHLNVQELELSGDT